jgi:hypothetical protein
MIGETEHMNTSHSHLDPVGEALAERLAQFPDYRLLRALPRPYCFMPQDGAPPDGRCIALLDLETTSLDPQSGNIIEIAIKLLGHGLGGHIPLTRVLWSMTFPDDYARDRMFCWLAHRLDRWQAWGEMAAEQGAQALSEHLLQLRFADELIDLP